MLNFFFQVSSDPYCTADSLDCVAKVAKEANDCRTPCTGVFADVFRADDTKLVTDKMELSNLIHGLANQGKALFPLTLIFCLQ